MAIPAGRILSVEELKKLGIDIEPLNETANVSAGRGSVASVVDSARFVSMRDDPAARQAYLDSLMAVLTAGDPDSDDSSGEPASRASAASASSSVGAIPLEYGVSGTGARTYSVPIFTAPDIKYAPSLSLVYNSQGGYGYGGYGWDIGGLSSITLTGETPYWDDNIKAASSSDADGVFSLDGIRLVRNTHRATRDSFPLVTATGPRILVGPRQGSSGYISRFIVLYPDGTRTVYGTGADLGFTLPSYPMTSSTSLTGDRIEYCYSLDSTDGNHALDSIRYGIDDLGNAAGAIRFTSTPSAVYGYYAGKKVRRSPRVTAITSVSGGAALYTYSLSYLNVGDAYLLKTISLTNASGEQFPPLEFTYGAQASPHSGQDSLLVSATRTLPQVLPPSGGGMVLSRGKFLPGSYNDGLLQYSDLPRYYEVSDGIYACGYEPTLSSQNNFSYAASIAGSPLVFALPTGYGFQQVDAVDTDGDGVDEIVRINCGATSSSLSATQVFVDISRYDASGSPAYSNTVFAYFSGIIDNASGTSPCLRTYRWGDFLGVGRAQLLVVTFSDNGFGESQTPYVALFDPYADAKLFDIESSFHLCFASDEESRLLCLDIDGDGRTELCHATSSGLRVYHCSNTGYSLDNTLGVVPLSVFTSDRVFYADINADGYVDIIQAPAPGTGSPVWALYTNTGEGFVQDTLSICTYSAGDGYLFMDIDRDGYPDLMKVSGGSLGHYPNQDGVSFGSYQSGNLVVSSLGSILPPNVVDYTSMSSFVTVDNASVREFSYTSYARPLRHIVQSTDSYGTEVNNAYGYLPHHSLSWTENPSGIDTAAGYQLRVLPVYVLTEAEGRLPGYADSDTSAVFLHDSYSWWDGVVHTRGLGFCGFSKTRTASLLDGVTTVSVSRFNPQKRGVPVSSAQYLESEGGTPYHSVEYTFDDNATTYGKMNPRLQQTVDHDVLTGITTTTSYGYDLYNYPTSTTTVRSSNVSGTSQNVTDATSITYEHHNNPGRYILGAVTGQFIRHDHNGDGEIDFGERIVISRDTLNRPVSRASYKVQFYSFWSSQQFLSSTDRWQYDIHGNVTREESAPAGSGVYVGKSYAYDASGRHLVSSTDELGRTTSYSSFDSYGNPATVTNHKGQQTHIWRDGWGRATRTVHPDGTIDSLARSWGGTGAYTETTTSSGKPDVSVSYDALGREVLSSNKRFDGQWQKVRTYYNQRGLVTRHSQPYRSGSEPSIYGWQWIYHTYDSYGRPLQVREGYGVKTSWSYSGLSVTETKEGVATTRTSDTAGNLITVSDPSGTVTYTLRDDGQPASVATSTGATVSFAYDTLGRRTSITDPAAGQRTTAYVTNADGTSSVTETNALGSIVSSYDRFGRATSVSRPDFNTAYSYDTLGRLVSVVSTNSTSTRYTYDAYDRPVTVRDSVPDGKWLQKHYYYGSDGNIAYLEFSSQAGFIGVEAYGYANGHLKSTTLIYPTTLPVYTLNAENNFGQPTSATSGSVSRSYSYSDYGKPTARFLGGGSLMEHRSFFNETTGNLTSRIRRLTGSSSNYLFENFSYDSQNRLTGTGSSTISYDTNNNITSLGGVGAMDYAGAVHPYTITDLDATAASILGTDNQSVTYTAYDRPASISQGDYTATFTYGADGGRVRMTVTDATGPLQRNYYIGGRYEVITDDYSGGDTQILWLGGDAYNAPVALYKTSYTSWTPYIIGRDYLGSITHIATTSGTLVEERSYDAWGRLRDPATNAVYDAASQPTLFLGRGFCGHEHLPLFSLINMNARLYDPVLGRFLSPDPYVQAPDIPGNFNRYAYCLNNPLKYVDQRGEFIGTINTALVRFPLAVIKGIIIPYFVGFWSPAKAGEIAGEAWNEYGQRVTNAFKIDMGLFATDSGVSVFDNALTIISRFTWERIPTSVGNFVSHFRNNFWVVDVEQYNGATLVNRNSGEKWGMTIGSYINGQKLKPILEEYIFAHEYGHTKQSKRLGPLYLPMIGIPSFAGSFFDYDLNAGNDHDREWYEVWANNLSYNYHKDTGISDIETKWNSTSNPLIQQPDWFLAVTIAYYLALVPRLPFIHP